MEKYKKTYGSLGERAAAEFLKKAGHKIIEANYTCKIGEADIISRDGEYIVFSEVKTRRSDAYGTPAEAVNFYKQRKIVAVANWYLTSHGLSDPVRLDVIEVWGKLSGEDLLVTKINQIKNAIVM